MIVYYILLLCSSTAYASVLPRVPQTNAVVRPTAETCMDNPSQPQLAVSPPISRNASWLLIDFHRVTQINNDCPSSLTNPSTCLARPEYKNRCLAYCEQFLYWFLGPEIPWPNSKCSADGDCRIDNTKGITITNGYQFTAGFLGTPLDALELAFNLGATYAYSFQTSTTQTFSQSKPRTASSSCGYWTFLPY